MIMLETGVDDAMTANRGEWNMTCADPKIRWDKGKKMMMTCMMFLFTVLRVTVIK